MLTIGDKCARCGKQGHFAWLTRDFVDERLPEGKQTFRNLDKDIEHNLGTSQYIYRDYLDSSLIGREQLLSLQNMDPLDRAKTIEEIAHQHPEAIMHLGLTYYTGMVDTVAHIPERCYIADGFDVSSHQTRVDWGRVKSDGISFAYIKATEGTGFVDPRFGAYWAGAKAAGLPRGAYHFARPDTNSGTTPALVTKDAQAEADSFLGVAYPKRGDLLPVLDLERNAVERRLVAETLGEPAQDDRRHGGSYLPVKTGLRFSRNALRPST